MGKGVKKTENIRAKGYREDPEERKRRKEREGLRQDEVDREAKRRRKKRRSAGSGTAEASDKREDKPIESKLEAEIQKEGKSNDDDDEDDDVDEDLRKQADLAWKEARDAEKLAEEALAKASELKRKAHDQANLAQKKLWVHRANLEKETQLEGTTSKASSLVGATPKPKPAPKPEETTAKEDLV